MFYYVKNGTLTNECYEEVSKNDFMNKELLLKDFQEKSLSLRMTEYIYNSEFKYHAIFRIRNKFKIKTIGYFD